MKKRPVNKIFASVPAAVFAGRDEEIGQLMSWAGGSEPLGVLAAPGAGASELLRQTFDRLFLDQDEVIPVYFEVRQSDGDARSAAARFVGEFLRQATAFRRRDPNLIHSSPDLSEIVELALPQDAHWIDRLVTTLGSRNSRNDDGSFVRNCLGAPLRAAANGSRSFVMIDSVDVALNLDGGRVLFEALNEVAARSSVPFILSGRRRSLFGSTKFKTIDLGPLSFRDAGTVAENLAARAGTLLNEETRDLIAVQLSGNTTFIGSIFAAADEGDLTSFERFEQVYTDEIYGGRIGRHLDAVLRNAARSTGAQDRILGLMFETMQSRGARTPVNYWQKLSGLSESDFETAIHELHCAEVVNLSSGSVSIDLADIVVCDYVRARVALEIDGESRALAVGEALSDNIKRAPKLMAGFYRRNASIGLRELLLAFSGQAVSPALIEYGRFKAELKGADNEKIASAVKEDKDRIELPRIVYTAHTSAFYPALRELCDAERSAIGLGFADQAERTETAVIAVEIDSKLEAKRELAEFWCDRLEMAAEHCDLEAYRIWLISPEGFADDALELLRERNAYGSSRKQIQLLAEILNANVRSEEDEVTDNFEIVVPMGEDTEIIAARTIEDIAKKHDFPQKAINQIKTAVVEACINAAEHSLSPDQKIYQRFAVDDEKITITIWNRGLRLADKQAVEPASDEARRGWGLKLIKGLMDDVKIERTDDGTRITMTKFLKSE